MWFPKIQMQLNNNARKEEVLSFCLVRNLFFKGKAVVVGDNGYNPDIYTADGTVGAEVVTCELMETYKFIRQKRMGAIEGFNKKKLKKPLSKYQGRYKRSAGRDRGIKGVIYMSDSSTEKLRKKEYKEHLTYILTKKLDKLQSGNYHDCQSVSLVILSDFISKNFISIDEVSRHCKEVMSEYEGRSFDNIALSFNNKVYLINKEGEHKVVIEEPEFNERMKHFGEILAFLKKYESAENFSLPETNQAPEAITTIRVDDGEGME